MNNIFARCLLKKAADFNSLNFDKDTSDWINEYVGELLQLYDHVGLSMGLSLPKYEQTELNSRQHKQSFAGNQHNLLRRMKRFMPPL